MTAKKFFIIIIAILTIVFAFNNSSSINTIDELAYVVAIGFDVGKTSKLSISFQISLPTDSSSSESSSSSSDSSAIINTVECNSLASGLSLLNSYLSKKVNLSHCKVIVFSEELASDGINDFIYTLKNNIEVRPTCDVLISKCSAKYFVENSKPLLSDSSSKYYKVEAASEKNTGYTKAVSLKDFFSDISDTFGEPYAILGSINGVNSNNAANSSMEPSDNNYVGVESDSKKNIENLGLAVFKRDKLVGELSGLETIFHLVICNDFKTGMITIPSPFEDAKYLSLSVSNAGSQNSVSIINGTPFIKCNAHFSVRIMSATPSANYMSEENRLKIEEYANSYLKSQINNYLYKTSKQFKSDICKFGKKAVHEFKTWTDWENYNWLDNYENSFFEVNVSTDIKSSYLVMET